MQMRYRDEFPPDCPPLAAREISGARTVYRLANRIPVQPRDFQATWQRRPGDAGLADRECFAKGLSVFTELDDARLALEQRGNGCIAELQLARGMGVIQQTPAASFSSHCTWWPVFGINYDDLAAKAVR